MPPGTRKIRLVCISDTHNKAPGEGYTLPQGDVLIHAGDLTNQGSYAELQKAVAWLEKADFAVKIVIAGNHDLDLDASFQHESGDAEDRERSRELLKSNTAFTYLEHASTVIHLPDMNFSLRIFGSPYSPIRSETKWAFQYPDAHATDFWTAIPGDTDILITHTPPAGHLDSSTHWSAGGCAALLEALWRVRPRLHICGHCHEERGAEVVRWSDDHTGAVESVRQWRDPGGGAGSKKQSLLDLSGSKREGGLGVLEAGRETAVVNASIMAKSFGPGAREFNKPIVVDIAVSVSTAEGSEPGVSISGE